MSQYECPSCNAVVWHQCQPASYWRGRRLRRSFSLRRLQRLEHTVVAVMQDRDVLPAVESVDREEILEADRERWREDSPVYTSLEDALGDRAYLPGDDES